VGLLQTRFQDCGHATEPELSQRALKFWDVH
jgi:hypothetical protein